MNPPVDESVIALTGLLSVLFLLTLYVWGALALSAVFRKMGEESWKGWVPLLNAATLLQWGGFTPWLVLLVLIPGFGIVIVWVLVVISAHRINPGFGYGAGMTVLAALLSVVWASILGFGPARWRGARAVARTHVPSSTAARSAAHASFAPKLTVAPAWAPPDVTSHPPLAATPTPAGVDRAPISAVPAAPLAPPAPAVPGNGPIAAVPGRRSGMPPVPAVPPVTRVPDAQGGTLAAPDRRTLDEDDPDAFPERSGSVSDIVGSPSAGAPRSAVGAVPAQHRQVEEGERGADSDDLDVTVIARRTLRPRWELVPALGSPIALTATVVILGRNPAADPAFPAAQLVSIRGDASTVSKTHARIEQRGNTWFVTDLGSTNGVLVSTLTGDEVALEPGGQLDAGERFFLGDEEFHLRRTAP